MHQINSKIALPLVLVIVLLTSCKKDEEDATPPGTMTPPVNEQELITTVRLTLNTLSDAEYKYMLFSDPDGPGGNAPVIMADTLSADSLYLMNVEVYNASASPADDLTPDILAEGTEHQFFYDVTGASMSIFYGDADANGQPIGQYTNCNVFSPSTGTLKVTLRHMPDKSATGVAQGDITNAGGDTDIEVTFPVVID